MASTGLQILKIILMLLGWVNALLSCALALWKVTAFISNITMAAQVVWEELQMSCMVQSTGQMQCMVYAPLLVLPQDQQTARDHPPVGSAWSVGYVEDKDSKGHLVIFSEIIFIISGILPRSPSVASPHNHVGLLQPPGGQGPKVGGGAFYLGWAASGPALLS